MMKLVQASEPSTDTQHIILCVYTEGRVYASGSDNLDTRMIWDEGLFTKI